MIDNYRPWTSKKEGKKVITSPGYLEMLENQKAFTTEWKKLLRLMMSDAAAESMIRTEQQLAEQTEHEWTSTSKVSELICKEMNSGVSYPLLLCRSSQLWLRVE